MIRSQEQAVSDPTYLEFFGLARPPFASLVESSQLFQSEQYSLLMEHLTSATRHNDSIVVVRGADGSGKTTLLQHYLTGLDEHTYFVAIDETCRGEEQFYHEFLTQIGFAEIDGSAAELRKISQEFLLYRGNAGDPVLLVIDNAHLIDPIILEQMRQTAEVKSNDQRVLSVVLAGNADIVRVSDAPALRQTKFNSHVVFNIRNYTEEETASYVWHRLNLAGGNDGVKFANEAHPLIHRYSGGIPRLINKLCNDMLTEAHRMKSRVITEKIVRTVADKQRLLPHVIPLHGKGRRKTDPDFDTVKEKSKPTEQEQPGKPKTTAKPESKPEPQEPVQQLKQAPADAASDDLLQHVSQLSSQVAGLQADKVRALQDVAARNEDIGKLRNSLDSKTSEIEKLTVTMAASANELAKHKKALSDSCAALRDSEGTLKDLSASLEKERRVREARENELAKAVAAIDDLKARLTVAEERTSELGALEKSAAEYKAESEQRSHEIDSLRKELASRDEVTTELEARLQESQKECASAQRRIEALRDPQDLHEIEELAERLTTELEEQSQKREAAETELAKLKASVDELGEHREQLEANVDELKSELETAAGRVTEFEVLEKSAADLTNALAEKDTELASLGNELAARDEKLVAIEKEFVESQNACELAQRRLLALKSPKEIEEIEQTSARLAADVEKETLQREAAEEEAARTAAAIDDLEARLKAAEERAAEYSESKIQLQAKVADLEVKLQSADERAIKLAASAADGGELADDTEFAIAELRSLKSELASREEALANLEKRLAKAQEESSSAQQRVESLLDPQELQSLETKLASREEAFADLEKRLAEAQEDSASAQKRLESMREPQELQSLENELASREEAIADLEKRLTVAQEESASAQQRLESLRDPKELQEIEKVADKLAAELAKESSAREAAEKELAKVAATVEELHKAKLDGQAKIDELVTELKAVEEKGVEHAVLEKSNVALKDLIEEKSDELDALRRDLSDRDRAMAELEQQLDALHAESESQQSREAAPRKTKDAKSKKAAAAPAKQPYPSHVVEKFEQSIKHVSAYQTLRKYDPGFYADLVALYKNLVGQDFTDKQIDDALRTKQAKLIESLLPRTSDEAVLAYARLIISQLDDFDDDGAEPCFTLLIPPAASSSGEAPVYSDTTRKRELSILEKALRTYKADRRLPGEEDVWPDLGPIFEDLFEEYGEENVAALQHPYDPDIDRKLVCGISRSLYSAILELPKRSAVKALRWILSP